MARIRTELVSSVKPMNMTLYSGTATSACSALIACQGRARITRKGGALVRGRRQQAHGKGRRQGYEQGPGAVQGA